MPRIAILGANGFVGRAMCASAAAAGHEIVALMRHAAEPHSPAGAVIISDLENIAEHLQNCDWMVNCAGRAHVLKNEEPARALAGFRSVNRDLALEVAIQAKSAGVRRFVQISSVAAVGSKSSPGEIFRDSSPPAPDRPYGVSKLEADQALAALSDSRMGIVSLRPPALIGRQPAGFVARLARAADKGIPLPFGKIDNRRSFVSVDNLASAVLAALSADIDGAFLVTDSDPMSVGQLYSRLLEYAGHPGRCFDLPVFIVDCLASLALGQRRDSLMGDAAYDGSGFALATGWVPPLTMDEALAAMMADIGPANASNNPAAAPMPQ